MMKRYFTFIVALLFFFTLSSCKKTQQPNSTFDENVNIKMSENIDSTRRTLILNCFTEKIFGCVNYSIQATSEIKNNKITINFIKIISPSICLTALGPASTVINFDNVQGKNYELELNFPETKITGQLAVSTGAFKATLPAQAKVHLVNPDLKRVPDNTIYGTVHYHTLSTQSTVQKFIDSLQFLGATPALYTPGDYGQFIIDPNGQIKQTQDLDYYFTQYYIFNYTNNSAQLKSLVKRFGTNYPDSLLITLNTTKGETFYSWTQ